MPGLPGAPLFGGLQEGLVLLRASRLTTYAAAWTGADNRG